MLRPRWQGRRGGGGLVLCDPLREPEALVRAATGARAILCLAGVVIERADSGAPLSDNTALALAALRAGADAGVERVFLASSAAVYGRQGGVLDETAPCRPVTPYGAAKVDMEDAARAQAAALGVPVTALRIGNIAGLDAILGNWRPGFQLDRFDDGHTPLRSYIGVQSLARVLATLMGARDMPPVLNIAAPGAVEMGALLDAAGRAWQPRAAPPSAIARVELDVDALMRLHPLDAATPAGLVAQWRAWQALDTDPDRDLDTGPNRADSPETEPHSAPDQTPP